MNSSDGLVDSEATSTLASADEARLTSRVRIAALCFLPLAGLIEAVASRHLMQNDGIAYLDMGDAIVRGDWKMGLNGVWSPLYPLLQGLALKLFNPSSYSQFTVVHCVNVLIYLFALGCFDFLLRVVVADRPWVGNFCSRISPLPKWTFLAVGYSVFLWSSLSLITLRKVTPDMLVAGFLYLAVALLLRIREQPESFSRFVLLGGTLGLGYLAKAPFFPLAFVFFTIAWILAGGWRRATPRVLAAVLVFLAVSAPWFIGLSQAKGRIMFGDSARFNYVFHVNGAGPDWYFQDLGTAAGQYKHAVRKIFDAPPVYEFATPIKGTSPIEYDPSYWSEGAVPRVYLKKELSVIHLWLSYYFDSFVSAQMFLFVGFAVLSLMAGREVLFKQITAQWPIWLIGLVGLGMYALVHSDLRYVAGFFTLVWVGLYSGLKMTPSYVGRRLASLVALLVVIATGGPTAIAVVGHLKQAIRRGPHNQWQVAEDLQGLGVMPGDRVARLPAHYGLAWARLLRVRDVAEIPIENSTEFWCAKPEVQAQVIDTIRRLDVTVIVAEQIPPNGVCAPGPEWHKLGDGTYYALKLAPDGAK